MSIIVSTDPNDHSEPTSMATAKAMPRTLLAVRAGQRSKCRAAITCDWLNTRDRWKAPPSRRRYCAGAGGDMATAGGRKATFATARHAPAIAEMTVTAA